MSADLVLSAGAELAESPFFRSGTLSWVDGPCGEIHQTQVASGHDDVRRYGVEFGAAVPRADSDAFLAATSNGFAIVDGDGVHLEHGVAADEDLFMNDGACDSHGRFWASVNGVDDAPGRASLHVWAPDTDPRTAVDSGFALLNGIGWSPEGTAMYVVDSIPRQLFAYDFDADAGVATNRVLVQTFSAVYGLPDGLAVDTEGCLWIAFYEGGCVRRVAPDGRTLSEHRLPVSRPTSCAFGDGHDLYVTTAREGLTPADLEAEPHAGGIWHIDAGVAGLRTWEGWM
ncbi:MAG: SMP-30/gluconolactonase/LRE family protein [Mycobacterium sp.]